MAGYADPLEHEKSVKITIFLSIFLLKKACATLCLCFHVVPMNADRVSTCLSLAIWAHSFLGGGGQ